MSPIIPLVQPEDFKSSKYQAIIVQESAIKIPTFDSGTPVEYLIEQKIATGSPMYKYTEIVLKGGAKDKFTHQVYLEGFLAVGNFTMVILQCPCTFSLLTQVLKDIPNDKGMYLHCQAGVAKSLTFLLSFRLYGTDYHSPT